MKMDLSPKVKRRQTSVQNEEPMLVVKEHVKAEKKARKNGSSEVKNDRKKGHSKERGESKSSRESTGSRKREKPRKDSKEDIFKDESKKKKDAVPSPPLSDDEKDGKKDEEFKGPMEPKEYAGLSGISRPRGTFFRIRGRGRARGLFAGTSTASVNTALAFENRPKEEEWDPEYTPKSKKYFLHDDRDDGIDYWARRARGRGIFQRGRGRFPFKKSGSPKWTHDKYQGDGLEDEEEMVEDGRQEEKE